MTRAPRCEQLAWAASGAMALTGHPGRPPELAPHGLVSRLWALLDGLRTGSDVDLDLGVVLSGRAAAGGLARGGRTSAGGAARLLTTRDGWCAVSLSRPDDIASVPAMFPDQDEPDAWRRLERAVAALPAQAAVERIQLLGVPAAVLPAQPRARGETVPEVLAARLDGALVVDLSSLWAGPLCSRVLHGAGARVVKVESTRRPDGAREGSRSFFDWLHAGKESVALDLASAGGRSSLARLLDAADVVIEASRPRALAQLGLAPDQLAARPGRTWVSITGWGRDHPDRVAFGDDAAVGAGLVARAEDGPVFCGDAIADPLTGLRAAQAVLRAVAIGASDQILDVSLVGAAASFLAGPRDGCSGPHDVEEKAGGWQVTCPRAGEQEVLSPRAVSPAGQARPLGVDTDRVLSRLG